MRFKDIHIGQLTTAPLKGGSVSSTGALRGSGTLILFGLALAIALVAVLEGLGSLPLPYDMALVDRALPRLFRLHMIASGIALALIPFVLIVRRNATWHRPLGWITAATIAVGGVTALPVSIASSSPALARAGLFTHGVVWLILLVIGVSAIRMGRREDHMRCMVAMCAVASGALWLRIGTALAAAMELPPNEAYVVLCWLVWLGPLLLIGCIVRRGHLGRPHRGSVAYRPHQSRSLHAR